MKTLNTGVKIRIVKGNIEVESPYYTEPFKVSILRYYVNQIKQII